MTEKCEWTCFLLVEKIARTKKVINMGKIIGKHDILTNK